MLVPSCGLIAAITVLSMTVSAKAVSFPPSLQHRADATPSCRYLPDDAGWPSWSQWQQLNQSVGGRLITGRPLAEICYGINADGDGCATLRDGWTKEQNYFPSPVEVMSPLFLNNSCTPFVNTSTSLKSSSCTLGNSPNYAINVSSAADVLAGLKFAQRKNLRLIVKSTGHDYLGRSDGKGSLSLWTHNLKTISFLNYTSTGYTGPAVRLGAGVQAFEIYAAVASRGLRITGGLCPTVGVAGGYVSGGGHGPLMGRYGLAADNSLEFEVVTPDRGYLIASPTQNADLFWALNGGGGSAYGVVLSQTTRVHADGPVAAATVTFNNTDNETYWAAIDAWHATIPSFNRIPGASSSFSVSKESVLIRARVPDGNTTAIKDTLAPFLAQVDLPYTQDITYEPTFYDYFKSTTADLPYGDFPTNTLIGGRLIPLPVVSSQNQRAELVSTIRDIVSSDTGFFSMAGNSADLSVSHTGVDNAVLPAWRNMAYTLGISVLWDPAAPLDLLGRLNDEVLTGQDKLRHLTPGSGIYINEATLDSEYWREDFYGPNYKRLLAIKRKYDSGVLLYGPGVVGSDYWTVASDGRLCRA
ncbi:FAD binding domain-containing protein [Xylaria digitata]|nr:FAD binding domain-containing protein [Xylaria digitata]